MTNRDLEFIFYKLFYVSEWDVAIVDEDSLEIVRNVETRVSFNKICL